ncbi:MAG: hypothetical protein ACC655_00985 [Rhodothermia bacterium]
MGDRVEPAFNKPEKPGISMGFDNVVSVYHVIEAEDDFESAAHAVFAMVRECQDRYPNWPRVVYLDVLGHPGDRGGFDSDMFEFQQEFMIGTMGPFLTALDMPLVSVWNPEHQRNDLPDQLAIQ